MKTGQDRTGQSTSPNSQSIEGRLVLIDPDVVAYLEDVALKERVPFLAVVHLFLGMGFGNYCLGDIPGVAWNAARARHVDAERGRDA